MYLRRCYRQKDGKRHAYWALVESYRTARGPRQRVVAYLGELDEQGRLGIERVAQPDRAPQADLFDREASQEWVEVDLGGVRVERSRPFGGGWLGLMLLRQLGLSELLEALMPSGREEIPWSAMTVVLVLGRLLDPSSELHLAEHGYEASALAELLGVPAAKVNDDRLYRTLDRLLPHKPAFHPTDEDLSVGTPAFHPTDEDLSVGTLALEKHLQQRLGELFDLDYDLLLYDVTCTYFEGAVAANPQAQRGYSRDHRPDCKQVNIALVVSRSGLPLGYEVFAGNRSDVTTVKEIVEAMESKYGKAHRIWVMDRGMVSAGNLEFLRQGGRRYILGTPKSMLRKFERQLLDSNWREVHEGLEVKLCPAPGGEEVFILCRSAQRRLKEQAMHDRFERRIGQKLEAMADGCGKRKQNPLKVAQQVGRLLTKKQPGRRLVSGESGSRHARMGSSALEQARPAARLDEVMPLQQKLWVDSGSGSRPSV